MKYTIISGDQMMARRGTTLKRANQPTVLNGNCQRE